MTRKVKSAERTLALLELFSARRDPLTVGQVTQVLAIPQASASMLLCSMRGLGYLSYDRVRRTYAPTVRMAFLGAPAIDVSGRGGNLRAALQRLLGRLDMPVFLAVQNDSFAQYACVLTHGDPAPVVVKNLRQPLSRCAAGHVLLTRRTDREIVGWAHRCGVEAAATEPRITAGDLIRLVRQAGEAGFAHTESEEAFDFGSIAVPADGPGREMGMAIGVGLASSVSDMRRSMLVQELKEAARGMIG